MEDDAIMLKQKKRKVAIDPDQEDEEQFKAVTTKTQDEKPDRENFEHKTNGDKPKEVKKQSEKKEEAKPDKSDAKNTSPTKPRPPADKDKQNVKKDTDQKPAVKPKPAASDSEKKTSEGNGQVQKKAPEERKSSQKPPAKKKQESESEGSDEESEAESDSEDDKPKKKQVSKPKPKPKPSPKQKAKKEEPGGKKVVGKDVLVYDVLKRWWYALPDWPPVGYDYSAELEKRKLRKVDQKYWRIEPEKDAKDFTKVYEIPSYPGVFKNSKGERIDLRPKDTCPSYEVFKKKSIPDLLDLKITALKNQIEALEKSEVVDEDLLKDLKKDLAVAEKTRAKMAEKAESTKNKV